MSKWSLTPRWNGGSGAVVLSALPSPRAGALTPPMIDSFVPRATARRYAAAASCTRRLQPNARPRRVRPGIRACTYSCRRRGRSRGLGTAVCGGRVARQHDVASGAQPHALAGAGVRLHAQAPSLVGGQRRRRKCSHRRRRFLALGSAPHALLPQRDSFAVDVNAEGAPPTPGGHVGETTTERSAWPRCFHAHALCRDTRP